LLVASKGVIILATAGSKYLNKKKKEKGEKKEKKRKGEGERKRKRKRFTYCIQLGSA
jgi:hypothetical protein